MLAGNGRDVNQRLKGGVVFLVLGLGFLVGGGYPAYEYVQDSQASEAVDAEVLASDYGRITGSSAQDNEYYVDVTYRYTYEGETYENDGVFLGGGNGELRRGRAEEVAENYAAGDAVTIYVVDGDPGNTYLVRQDMPYWYYILPGIGLILASLGALNVVQGVRGVGPLSGGE